MSNQWSNVKLGDILTLRRDRIELEFGITYKRITVKLGGLGVVLRDEVDGSVIKSEVQFIARAGQFVASKIDARNGSFGLVPLHLDGSVVSGNFLTFECNTERLLPKFIEYYANRPTFWEQCSQISEGTTNRVPVRVELFMDLPIKLPSLAEQQRMVERIDRFATQLDEAKNLRHQAVKETEALVSRSRAVLFAELADRFSTRPLGDLISMSSGEGLTSSQMDYSAPYPVYGGGGLNGRHTRYLFEEPTIVIGRVGARCGCVFVTEPKAWVTDNALYLKKISEELHSPYLVHALTTLDLRQQANQAAQPVVSQKKINPMRIPVPPLAEQRRIVAELDALQAEVDALKRLQAETAAELDALLPAILDRAFKGEL
jgi:type I restriction enzyme, S subunit